MSLFQKNTTSSQLTSFDPSNQINGYLICYIEFIKNQQKNCELPLCMIINLVCIIGSAIFNYGKLVKKRDEVKSSVLKENVVF